MSIHLFGLAELFAEENHRNPSNNRRPSRRRLVLWNSDTVSPFNENRGRLEFQTSHPDTSTSMESPTPLGSTPPNTAFPLLSAPVQSTGRLQSTEHRIASDGPTTPLTHTTDSSINVDESMRTVLQLRLQRAELAKKDAAEQEEARKKHEVNAAEDQKLKENMKHLLDQLTKENLVKGLLEDCISLI